MQPQLDPQAMTMAKAIREAEGFRGDPNIRGGSNEWGAYQFTKDTWDAYAKEAGVQSPWGQASLSEQNKVAYNKIKQWKDQGYNVGQVASMWNAGPGRPNAYAEGWRGVNEYGVQYDTPAYARKVAEAYQRYKAEHMLASGQRGQLNAGTEQPEQSLTSEVKDISTKRMGQMSTAIERGVSGEQGIGSTALQVGGAVAGAGLDYLGAGLKAIPVVGGAVETAEKALGGIAGAALGTDLGQQAVQAGTKFVENHPTAAANIGAVGNIASAIPIFRGIGMGVKGALSSPAMLKEALTPDIKKEAAAVAELQQTISRRATGAQVLRTAEKKGLDPLGTIVKERLVPDVQPDAKGTPRYDINKADAKIEESIDKFDDQLDEMLSSASMNIAGQVRLDDVKDLVLKEIQEEFKGDPDVKKYLKEVENDFDNYKFSYNRDFVSLNELNNIKRKVRKSVKFDTPSMIQDARYHEGQVMMKIIEQVGESQGLADVRRINKEMANRLEAQRIMRKYVHGKSVMENPGWDWMVGRGNEPLLVAGAEAAGQATGIYGAGALAGRYVSDKIRKTKPGAVEKLSTGGRKVRERQGLVRRTALPMAVTGQATVRGYQEEKQQ